MRRVEAGIAAMTETDLARLAAPIAEAEGDVFILCADTSSAPGRLLAGNLRLLRPGVRYIGGPKSSMAAEIANAGPDDVAIVIDFPRYEATVVEGARALARAGTPIVAITDGPFSPLAAIAKFWWPVDIGTVGPFDSVLPAIAIAELLIAQVAGLLRLEAANRLDHIEQLWEQASVFIDREDIRSEETR